MNIGDVITTAEQITAAPLDTILVDNHGTLFATVEGGVERVGDGWMVTTRAITFAPLTVLALPGRLPRPERVVKAEALREAASTWQVNRWADDMPKGSSRPALILGMAQRACDFLRARADRIEAGAE